MSAFQRRRAKSSTLAGIIVILFGMIAAPAYAGPPWDELGMMIYLGVLPLLVLLAGFIVSLFVSRAPWLHKVYTAIVIAYSLMGEFILLISGVVDPPTWAIPVFWLVPLLAWWGISTWLRRHARQRVNEMRSLPSKSCDGTR